MSIRDVADGEIGCDLLSKLAKFSQSQNKFNIIFDHRFP